MPSEKQMWDWMQPQCKKAGLHCERLTDRLQEGLPDLLWVRKPNPGVVYGTTGMLELKHLESYPQRLATTPLLTYGAHGLQIDQAFWLGRWARRGGRGGVLLRVGARDWWFWRAEDDPRWTMRILTPECMRLATACWGEAEGESDAASYMRGMGGSYRGPHFSAGDLAEVLCR